MPIHMNSATANSHMLLPSQQTDYGDDISVLIAAYDDEESGLNRRLA
jgi:hypothetical protein